MVRLKPDTTYSDFFTGRQAGQNSQNALSRAIERALRDGGVPAAAIGAVAASASGSPVQDAREALAIRDVIGRTTPVTAIKSMVGETLGASGPLNAIAMIESLHDGRVPGIAGLDRLDPEIDLAVTPAVQRAGGSHALVTAVAAEGNCCALVLGLD